jgi:hypothetical protein
MGGRRQDRTEPALRRRAGDFPEYVDAAVNDRLLLFGVQIGKDIVLRVGMGGDLVARLEHLLGGLRRKLQRMRIGAKRRLDVVVVKNAHEAPHARPHPVGAPRHGGTVMGAGFERGGLHRERRAFIARPVLQEAGHRNREPCVVGPGEAIASQCCHHGFGPGLSFDSALGLSVLAARGMDRSVGDFGLVRIGLL